MKKALFSALALSLAVTVSSCGLIGEKREKKSEEKSVAETTKSTEKQTETTEALDYEKFIEEEKSAVGIEDMILEKRASIKPDDNGFIIEDGILYDYVGTEPKVIIPDGVEKIVFHAFWSNDVIEAVYIPSSVKSIEDSTFFSCPNLKFVQIDEGLETIGVTAFTVCESLKDANLPESLTKIEFPSFVSSEGCTIHAPVGSYAEKYAEGRRLKYDNTYVEYANQ
ncbi:MULTISPECIES: leucine-rich repeat domain-containing protein [Ruminococcus]|uniref:Leucine rich repeat-containing protein n=1 Tax=Ruminococcus flavefaciens TaxID=1265 RepID=A0A1M7JRX2_RUMFL|nr:MULTISPECIES: leucine-rich repeat domain-containing protein [Ruminococcus]MCR4794515.1 leucine-rich repeat domain-containing protein [Ruminococcus sp.]SHM55661.1 Leucine rich repeat-containing protein [Ruminococcus flavefaciens]